MDFISIGGNSRVIGISYSQMNLVKNDLKRARDKSNEVNRRINGAKLKLQVDSGSSRVRVASEDLYNHYRELAKRQTKIDRMINNIDYSIRRYKEVDARCAARIRSIGRNYRAKEYASKKFDEISSIFNSGLSMLGNGLMGGKKSLWENGKDAFSSFCGSIMCKDNDNKEFNFNSWYNRKGININQESSIYTKNKFFNDIELFNLIGPVSFVSNNFIITQARSILNNIKSLEEQRSIDDKNRYKIQSDGNISLNDAEKLMYTKAFGIKLFEKSYFSNEIKNLPNNIRYKKSGYTYEYKLTERIQSFNGMEIKGLDLDIKDCNGEPIGNTKMYGYELVYTDEPKVSMGIIDVGNIQSSYARSIKASKLRTSKIDGAKVNVNIRAYRGLEDSSLLGKYEADPRLVVDMPFIGKGSSTANAEGWLRDSNHYWNDMLERHPDAFSSFNKSIIEGKHPTLSTPTNDATFRGYFEQYDVQGLRGTQLLHHHIGGGGQAIGVPKPLHPGFGGIHNAEKSLGIWGSDSQYAEMLQKFLNK